MRDGDELVFRYAHGIDALAWRAAAARSRSDALAETAARRRSGAPAVEVCALEVGGETAGALVAVGWRPFDEGARRLLETFSSQVGGRPRQRAGGGRRAGAACWRRPAGRRRRCASGAGGGPPAAVEAQEAERARVARELHDESGQVLTALAVHLRALEDDVGPGEIRDRIAEMRRSLSQASVGPPRAGDAACGRRRSTSTAWPTRSRSRRPGCGATGIAVDVELRGLDPTSPGRGPDRPLPRRAGVRSPTSRATAARRNASVVAERRTRAGCASWSRTTGVASTRPRPTSRLGLAGIRERVEMLGGQLRIESSPGSGTAVVVDLESG